MASTMMAGRRLRRLVDLASMGWRCEQRASDNYPRVVIVADGGVIALMWVRDERLVIDAGDNYRLPHAAVPGRCVSDNYDGRSSGTLDGS